VDFFTLRIGPVFYFLLKALLLFTVCVWRCAIFNALPGHPSQWSAFGGNRVNPARISPRHASPDPAPDGWAPAVYHCKFASQSHPRHPFPLSPTAGPCQFGRNDPAKAQSDKPATPRAIFLLTPSVKSRRHLVLFPPHGGFFFRMSQFFFFFASAGHNRSMFFSTVQRVFPVDLFFPSCSDPAPPEGVSPHLHRSPLGQCTRRSPPKHPHVLFPSVYLFGGHRLRRNRTCTLHGATTQSF